MNSDLVLKLEAKINELEKLLDELKRMVDRIKYYETDVQYRYHKNVPNHMPVYPS